MYSKYCDLSIPFERTKGYRKLVIYVLYEASAMIKFYITSAQNSFAFPIFKKSRHRFYILHYEIYYDIGRHFCIGIRMDIYLIYIWGINNYETGELWGVMCEDSEKLTALERHRDLRCFVLKFCPGKLELYINSVMCSRILLIMHYQNVCEWINDAK